MAIGENNCFKITNITQHIGMINNAENALILRFIHLNRILQITKDYSHYRYKGHMLNADIAVIYLDHVGLAGVC